MNEKQFESFKRIIKHESEKRMKKVIEMEIEAQPDKKDFLNGVFKSEFFRALFERGFIEGIDYEKKNVKTKYIVESE